MKRLALAVILIGLFMAISHPLGMEPLPRIWSKVDSKEYAKDRLLVWNKVQWKCLNNLWSKESAWNPTAYNKIKVMGRNAGGIPQILGMSPHTPPTEQIDRGLAYIYSRYTTPCNAWHYGKARGWY